MRKNLLKSSGFPMPVNPERDLARIPWAVSDSWYVKCEFESGDKILGFTWHQMITAMPRMPKMVSLESLFMNASDDVWTHKNAILPLSDRANAAADKCHVFTPYGGITGNAQEITLKYEFEGQKIDVVISSTGEIEHQGVTGLLDYGSVQSYEYGIVNMTVKGTVTINGVDYPVENGKAWFDRQYGCINKKPEPPRFLPGQACWLWLGIDNLIDGKGAASFGDIYNPGDRMTFATFLHEDGSEANLDADITYDNIWTSKKTGFSYPGTIVVNVPAENFHVTLTSLAKTESVEFVVEGKNKGLSGCQCLFMADGTYKGHKIHHVCDVETIGDLCGEDIEAKAGLPEEVKAKIDQKVEEIKAKFSK